MIIKEVLTDRYYRFEGNELTTAYGNIYMRNVSLEWLLENGYKKSRKKKLVPKKVGRIYGICYKV